MINSLLTTKNVCAVIVTYNPNIKEFKENLNSILNELGNVCIVDNSTSKSIQKDIINLNHSSVKIITLNENKGIALAQNYGMDWAFSNGYYGVLLLDQDSRVSDGMVEVLCNEYNMLVQKSIKVACIGPLIYNRDSNEKTLYGRQNVEVPNSVVEVEKTLSSGSLISKEAYSSIGEMDSSLFIDLVDWEWCWRAKKKEYVTYISTQVIMAHRLGEGRKKILGFDIGIPAPIRHYYQFRNYLILFKRDYVPRTFKIKYLIIYILKFFFYVFFVSPRKTRFKWMVLGISDAFKGVHGPVKVDRG